MILDGQEKPISEELRFQLSIVRRNISRLENMIGNLVEFNRLSSGTARLFEEPVIIGDMLNEALRSVALAAQDKRISLPPEVDFHSRYNLDRDMMLRVFLNLLDNALNYTDQGGEIRFELLETDSSLAIRVRDTGAGIPQDQLEKVFDRFFRANSSNTRRHGGMGLGLSICREILRLHGGEISAQSNPGRGTVFTVSLPASRRAG
ncbi:MAG: HAMP domain-containing sensor histidine kinase [Candidatus Wallbacteria bacterium]|nr:HAMP domain-containing sensor histidine kinase [Candidatus Wallbacteria bacterium]